MDNPSFLGFPWVDGLLVGVFCLTVAAVVGSSAWVRHVTSQLPIERPGRRKLIFDALGLAFLVGTVTASVRYRRWLLWLAATAAPRSDVSIRTTVVTTSSSVSVKPLREADWPAHRHEAFRSNTSIFETAFRLPAPGFSVDPGRW